MPVIVAGGEGPAIYVLPWVKNDAIRAKYARAMAVSFVGEEK